MSGYRNIWIEMDINGFHSRIGFQTYMEDRHRNQIQRTETFRRIEEVILKFTGVQIKTIHVSFGYETARGEVWTIVKTDYENNMKIYFPSDYRFDAIANYLESQNVNPGSPKKTCFRILDFKKRESDLAEMTKSPGYITSLVLIK